MIGKKILQSKDKNLNFKYIVNFLVYSYYYLFTKFIVSPQCWDCFDNWKNPTKIACVCMCIVVAVHHILCLTFHFLIFCNVKIIIMIIFLHDKERERKRDRLNDEKKIAWKSGLWVMKMCLWIETNFCGRRFLCRRNKLWGYWPHHQVSINVRSVIEFWHGSHRLCGQDENANEQNMGQSNNADDLQVVYY